MANANDTASPAPEKGTTLIEGGEDNTSAYDATGLRMDRERTQRFSRALSRMARAIHSIEAAGATMKGQFDTSKGVMDPCATIQAFSTIMNEDINLVFQMLANEEAPEGGA